MRFKHSLKDHKFSWIFFLPIILSLVGLFFVFESSSVKSFQEFNDSFHYFKLQSIWIGLGIAGMIFFSFFDYHNLYYLSFIFMFGTILLLMFVLIPGLGHAAGGARRWIDLGMINLQPTELAKFCVIIYLASWFTQRERRRFFSFMILLCMLMFLIILQPDMGTAIIIFLLALAMYFYAGIDLHYLLFLAPVSAVAFFVLIKISPYRFKRFTAFLNPQSDPLGIGYHINQILISLTSGGLLGQGIGTSRQKYLFLPEAHTDSIFAIIAEEFGFAGCIFLLILFFSLILHAYKITAKASDRFGRLLAGGIFAFFNLQIIINLGSMVNIMPLTGVPLPFISYGGSNLLVSFALMGVLLNIAKKS